MAERVGFVPGEPASCNDLRAIQTARTRQIHSKSEYEVQNRYHARGWKRLVENRSPASVEGLPLRSGGVIESRGAQPTDDDRMGHHH